MEALFVYAQQRGFVAGVAVTLAVIRLVTWLRTPYSLWPELP